MMQQPGMMQQPNDQQEDELEFDYVDDAQK